MSTTTVDAEPLSRARTLVGAGRENRIAVLDAVAQIDIVGTGYASLERLLEDLFHVDRREAKQLVRHTAALIPMVALSGETLPPRAPATADVCSRGAAGPAHVDIILAALDRLARVPEPVLAEAEEVLADAATYLAPRALGKVAERLIATLDPDGAAPEDDYDPVDELQLGTRRNGALNGTFRFHAAADRDLIREVLDALSMPAGPEDPRGLATRQAEAFLDLIAQAVSPTGIAASPITSDDEPHHDDQPDDQPGEAEPDRSRARPLGRAGFTVTMDLEWLRAQVGHGTLDSENAISPAEARRLACDAGVVAMVLGSRSEPLDVGRLSYAVPEGMRRTLTYRDGGCAFPGCTRRPGRCAAHHVRHWAEGGATTLQNLALLCRYHHRLIHQDHWHIHMRNGRPWFVPPRWIDPDQTARPGGRSPLRE